MNWPIGRYPLAQAFERALEREHEDRRSIIFRRTPIHAYYFDQLDRERVAQGIPSALVF